MNQPATGTCKLCGIPVVQVPTVHGDDWYWRASEPDTETGVPHTHYSTSNSRKLTKEERDALPRHCGWPLFRAPSGWWCRECDRPLPEHGDWNGPQAATSLVWKIAKATPKRTTLLQQAATQPVLALLRALQQAGASNDHRALHYELAARATIATLDEDPDPWQALPGHLIRGPIVHTPPSTLHAARRYAAAHTTKDTTVHVIPVPTTDPAETRHGWATISKGDHQ